MIIIKVKIICILLLAAAGCTNNQSVQPQNQTQISTIKKINLHRYASKSQVEETAAAIRGYVQSTGDTTEAGITKFLIHLQPYPVLSFTQGNGLKVDYRNALSQIPMSTGGRQFLHRIDRAVRSLIDNLDMPALQRKLNGLQKELAVAALPVRDLGCLHAVLYIVEQLSEELLTNRAPSQEVLARGIGSLIRKAGAIVCAIGAAATIVAWHYMIGSPYDHLFSEATRWGYHKLPGLHPDAAFYPDKPQMTVLKKFTKTNLPIYK